jgi:hypothetical protein
MIEWPGRCRHCGQHIEDWSQAGSFEGRWIHKECWLRLQQPGASPSNEASSLGSPIDRSKVLELPMFVSLMLFHFGLGAGFIGWIMLTQTNSDATASALVMAIGLITPILGVAGVALNIISRRRVEMVRQSLDLQGGWKPGR